MTVFIVVSIIVLVGVAVAATLGRFGHTDLQMYPPTSTAGGWGVGDDSPLHVDDLGDIRFDTALRGYRMDQVDAMIARLQAGQAGHSADEATSRSGGGTEAVSGDHDAGELLDSQATGDHGAGRASIVDQYPAKVHPFTRKNSGDV